MKCCGRFPLLKAKEKKKKKSHQIPTVGFECVAINIKA
jgi:hypothetical protein